MGPKQKGAGLQRAINAIAAKLGSPVRVAVDGIVGPKTVAALKSLQNDHRVMSALILHLAPHGGELDWARVAGAAEMLARNLIDMFEGEIGKVDFRAPGAKALPRTWDHLYREHGAACGIPVAYLRALAKWESGTDPKKHTIWDVPDPKNPGKTKKLYGGRGLLQVVSTKDYNKAHGTSWKLSDMFDPAKNVPVAVFTLCRAIKAMASHPDKNMKADWSNPHFVELLTAGWNSGWSNRAGVPKAAAYLEARGIPVTLANLGKHRGGWSKAIKRNFANNNTLSWAPKVRRTYFAQPDAPGAEAPAPAPAPATEHPALVRVERRPGGGVAVILLLGAAGAAALAKASKS